MAAPSVGVLALQGAFAAHAAAFHDVGVTVREVRRVSDLDGLRALAPQAVIVAAFAVQPVVPVQAAVQPVNLGG